MCVFALLVVHFAYTTKVTAIVALHFGHCTYKWCATCHTHAMGHKKVNIMENVEILPMFTCSTPLCPGIHVKHLNISTAPQRCRKHGTGDRGNYHGKCEHRLKFGRCFFPPLLWTPLSTQPTSHNFGCKRQHVLVESMGRVNDEGVMGNVNITENVKNAFVGP